jgi:hypothetical protein
MNKLKALLAVCLGLSLPIAALAGDWTKWKPDDFELSDPPKKSSVEHRRELELMMQHQNSDREEACALGRKQQFGSYDTIFGRSTVLTEAEAEKAKPLVHKVLVLTQKISKKFKKEYDRKRPFAEDSKIKPCVRRPGNGESYPSSHASMGYAGGCILAKIFPKKEQLLVDYGQHVGDIRAVVGVHFPSDVRAGQEIGAEVCKRLLDDKDFKKELRDL